MQLDRTPRRLATIAVLLVCTLVTGCGAGEDEEPEELTHGDDVEVPARVSELSDTHDSIYALADAILSALQEGDSDALLSYRVDEAEWYHVVWPELPASQPGRNLPWDYAWRDLDQKSRNAARRTMDDMRGRSVRLIRVEFRGETTEYETYRVHRDARCVVEREDGEVVTLDLFGSVIERNGRFKAFSYVVD